METRMKGCMRSTSKFLRRSLGGIPKLRPVLSDHPIIMVPYFNICSWMAQIKNSGPTGAILSHNTAMAILVCEVFSILSWFKLVHIAIQMLYRESCSHCPRRQQKVCSKASQLGRRKRRRQRQNRRILMALQILNPGLLGLKLDSHDPSLPAPCVERFSNSDTCPNTYWWENMVILSTS